MTAQWNAAWENKIARIRQRNYEARVDRDGFERYLSKLKKRYGEGAGSQSVFSSDYPVYLVRSFCGTTYEATSSKSAAFGSLGNYPLSTSVWERIGSSMMLAVRS